MISSLLCSKHLNVPRVVFKITTDDRLWYQKKHKKNLCVVRLTDCECAQRYSLRSAAKQTQDKR